MTSLQLKQEGKVNKVLVVVLAPTRLQWMNEIQKFTNEEAVLFAEFRAKYRQQNGKRYVSESIEDQKKSTIDYFKHSEAMYMVMSYQTLQQNAKLLEEADFDMVIFDEAHNIKNKDSKTNKAAKELIKPRTKKHRKGFHKGIAYTLLVTGTPVMNYPDDLFGLVGMANEKIFGKYKDFRKEYLTLNVYHDVIGYRHLDEFVEKIQSFYIRRTDNEIGLSLPKIVEETIWIDPHPNQIEADEALKEYQKKMIQEKMDALRQGKKDVANSIEQKMKGILGFRITAGCHPNVFKMSKNENIMNRYGSYAVKNEMDIPKFNRCIEMVQEIVDNGHKVVVFVESRRMTVLLHRAISKFTRAVRYIGGLTDEVRERRKYKFNNDPSCRVMIANGAGSTGLTLVLVALIAGNPLESIQLQRNW